MQLISNGQPIASNDIQFQALPGVSIDFAPMQRPFDKVYYVKPAAPSIAQLLRHPVNGVKAIVAQFGKGDRQVVEYSPVCCRMQIVLTVIPGKPQTAADILFDERYKTSSFELYIPREHFPEMPNPIVFRSVFADQLLSISMAIPKETV